MKKEIRTVDTEHGIVQVTTVDERWYVRPITDPTTGLPTHEFVPSVTWICESYPKGVGFYKWLANKGWDEAEALKEAAGDKGTKVHRAIVDLLDGMTVAMEAAYVNPSTEQPEGLTLQEYRCLMSFVAWYQATAPKVLGRELVVWNDAQGYAGTVDLLCEIDGKPTLVDFKTSKSIWPSHRMQVSAYQRALPESHKPALAILQLGYEKNRLGYKFTEVEECFDLFLAAKTIWATETQGQRPSQKEYPLSLSLQPATAPAMADAPPTPEVVDGNAGRLGKEEQQAGDSRRRGKRRSHLSRV